MEAAEETPKNLPIKKLSIKIKLNKKGSQLNDPYQTHSEKKKILREKKKSVYWSTNSGDDLQETAELSSES